MAQNFIQPGDVLPYTAPSGGVTSGTPVKIGSMVGIPLGSAAEGGHCEVALTGVWQAAKATGATWAVGDKLYWDDAAKNFTKTTTSNTAAGYAFAAAATGDAVGLVLLKQIA